MPRTTTEIKSGDVPQAPNLARVRCVVTAIAGGAVTNEQIAEETDFSVRHIGYAARAAQTLGLLDADRHPTELGRALIETEQESEQERDVLRKSVEQSAILRVIAPGLLSPKPPTKRALAARIERASGLSKATSEHRASDLLSWREQILEEPEAAPAPPEQSDPTEPG